MSRRFNRVLTEGDVMRRRASVLQRIHIDGWLLFLLLVLGVIGLFVLYSAGGQDQNLLIKQASSFGVGLLVMLVVTQFEPRFMARWSPLQYVLCVNLNIDVAAACSKGIRDTRR